jgi:hypothetical protein
LPLQRYVFSSEISFHNPGELASTTWALTMVRIICIICRAMFAKKTCDVNEKTGTTGGLTLTGVATAAL